MNELEARRRIAIAGFTWAQFLVWIDGQTVGIYPNGGTIYYAHDVDRFCRRGGPRAVVTD